MRSVKYYFAVNISTQNNCSGAGKASEQQHNQDLREIYNVDEFWNSSLLPECISFNQSALRHFLPECIAHEQLK